MPPNPKQAARREAAAARKAQAQADAADAANAAESAAPGAPSRGRGVAESDSEGSAEASASSDSGESLSSGSSPAPPDRPSSDAEADAEADAELGAELGADADADMGAGRGAAEAAGEGASDDEAAAGPGPGPGWPAPAGARPPAWPPAGAELLSAHAGAEALAAAAPPCPSGRPQPRLCVAALACPQPEDAMQWRLFPLVRQCLALQIHRGDKGAGADAPELARFVEGNLPAAFLAGVSRQRLRGLVALVLSRSVRRGRLLRRGKHYALPPAEAAAVPLPALPGAELEAVWVAWCVETKRPREVALRYRFGPAAAAWLCARPAARGALRPRAAAAAGAAVGADGPAEDALVGSTAVQLVQGPGGAVCASWWDAGARTTWTLAAPPGALPPDALPEVVLRAAGAAGATAGP